ncbi:atp-dependent dna helicase pif1 [Moniliophthora roreri MCA 2997]|uniref:Atp-dependent dna helicase pif1 n=1 Tax=Moniliophthora roreri (strain MCA 2997) TaxID=1381753 RepID=V2WKD6_MONRO|nr:atp-dependent dna helicase pif1 [Moniliophthora roreri MCA 2997]
MISESTIREYSEKLKTNPFAHPESDGEKAAAKLMKYVNYVGDHLPGSIAKIQSMQEEMFSIVNTNGLPHVFLTLNPSDTNSPIAQPTAENLEHSTFISLNPVAGAEFFHICVKNMLEILLEAGRESRKGVFGEVEVYYGVVEAQGQGRLHIHLLIWLKGGLSPIELRKCESEPELKEKLTKWYNDIFSRNMPENTHPYI